LFLKQLISSVGLADEVLEKVRFNYRQVGPYLHFTHIVQSCFYQLKVIVLMKGIVSNNFQKVRNGLGEVFAFSKISNCPPFVDLSVVCGLPLAFDPNISKLNSFEERNGFRQFSESLD
jgi:hypothetical protein